MKLQVCVFFFATCMFVTGCSSGVQPAGPDTYFISKGSLPIWMSAAGAKADCYKKANQMLRGTGTCHGAYFHRRARPHSRTGW